MLNVNATAVNTNKQNKQWVYVKLISEMRKDTATYSYYYGCMNKNVVEQIKKNDISGMFILSDMRFLNDSDKLELYENNLESGMCIFRVKDIVRLDLEKKDPVLTYKVEELTDSAKAFLKKHY